MAARCIVLQYFFNTRELLPFLGSRIFLLCELTQKVNEFVFAPRLIEVVRRKESTHVFRWRVG